MVTMQLKLGLVNMSVDNTNELHTHMADIAN